MGIYINKGYEGFVSALNGEYVDKTGMIKIINNTLDTERRYTCITRSRRFGKSMALDMLCAYYDKSCDSRKLFEGLSISEVRRDKENKVIDRGFEKHLNKYPVICLDITDFITRYGEDPDIVTFIQRNVMKELHEVYPEIKKDEDDDLMELLIRIQQHTGEKFIMLIDEWDAICREFSNSSTVMDEYVKLLRRLFKGGKSKDVFAGAYLTGILPIKKYKTESALNNFREYSVVKPGALSCYFGFTPKEVERLAEKSEVSMEELKDWYGGYTIGNELSMFNPHSVKEAIYRAHCYDIWKGTSSIGIVSDYIRNDFDGITTTLFSLINGEKYNVDITKIDGDISAINNKEQILAILIHLGYLSYNFKTGDCLVPNKDAAASLENSILHMGVNYDKETNTHTCKIEKHVK